MYNPGGAISDDKTPVIFHGRPKGKPYAISFCVFIIIHLNEKCKAFLKKILDFSQFCIKVFNRVDYFVHFDGGFSFSFSVT